MHNFVFFCGQVRLCRPKWPSGHFSCFRFLSRSFSCPSHHCTQVRVNKKGSLECYHEPALHNRQHREAMEAAPLPSSQANPCTEDRRGDRRNPRVRHSKRKPLFTGGDRTRQPTAPQLHEWRITQPLQPVASYSRKANAPTSNSWHSQTFFSFCTSPLNLLHHRKCESGCAYHGITDFVTNTLMKVQHVAVSENSVHNSCVLRTVIWTWRFVLSRQT